jgi:hypothetical protein
MRGLRDWLLAMTFTVFPFFGIVGAARGNDPQSLPAKCIRDKEHATFNRPDRLPARFAIIPAAIAPFDADRVLENQRGIGKIETAPRKCCVAFRFVPFNFLRALYASYHQK